MKKRLFEPELKYLSTKFREDYENLTTDMRNKLNKIVEKNTYDSNSQIELVKAI